MSIKQLAGNCLLTGECKQEGKNIIEKKAWGPSQNSKHTLWDWYLFQGETPCKIKQEKDMESLSKSMILYPFLFYTGTKWAGMWTPPYF